MISKKKILLLDMNNTFMFGVDRFGVNEDYSTFYKSIGGKLSSGYVNGLICQVYDYLEQKYPAEAYRDCFPTLDQAIDACTTIRLDQFEKTKISETFSHHEHGEIPEDYVRCLKLLSNDFTLSLVIDIWAPKTMWVETFRKLDLWNLFSVCWFSSDHGVVKPSPALSAKEG
ncbi:MAG: hypothetical protein ABW095_16705 [Candidatus Thiodiazotropha sp.]